MTKEVFLTRLRDSMAERKVDRANMDKYLRRFSRILENTPPQEVEKKIAEFGNPSDIADRIVNILAGAQEGSAAQKNQSAATKATPAAPNTAANQPQPPKTAPTEKKPEPGMEQRRKAAPPPSSPTYQRTGVRTGDGQRAEGRRPAVNREDSSDKGKQVFLWTAILTSPIWLFLLCVIGGLFLCAYTAVLLLAAALIVAEVAIVVGGVLLAVIGIVYGVMKILPGEATYIGLYELGLGIRNGGIVMLVSILIYNFVVNMAPLALKSLTKFLKYTAKKLKELVLRFRKECDR